MIERKKERKISQHFIFYLIARDLYHFIQNYKMKNVVNVNLAINKIEENKTRQASSSKSNFFFNVCSLLYIIDHFLKNCYVI